MKKLPIVIALAAVGVGGSVMAQPSQAGSTVQWTCPAGYALTSMRDGSPLCVPTSSKITDRHEGYRGPDSSATGIGKDIDTYGKPAGAEGSRVSTPRSKITDRHKGYSGPGSSSTEIGKDLDSYGKTSGAEGAGR